MLTLGQEKLDACNPYIADMIVLAYQLIVNDRLLIIGLCPRKIWWLHKRL